MKIVMELTDWAVPYRQPNHVYLMDGDRVLAYVPGGRGRPIRFSQPSRMELCGRQFATVKRDIWGFDLVDAGVPDVREWQVSGSRGASYIVTERSGKWQCTCAGFQFRGDCRHIQECQVAA
jgi:hypothetical protein